MLSLKEQRPEPAPRVTRAEGMIVSIGVHLLALLLLWILPGQLPPVLRALLLPTTPETEEPDAAAEAGNEAEKPAPIPLKFAYVRLPNDTPVESNKTAPLFSDANRLARQEAPTPPETDRFSIDPHSEGDSLERVAPDPDRPEGRQEPLPAGTPEADDPDGEESLEDVGTQVAEREPEPVGGEANRFDASGQDALPTSTDGIPIDPGEEGSGNGVPGGNAGGPAAIDPQQKLRQALHDVRSEEFKFTFHNPAYLRQGSYGTMSFDTQDFPWGDYARILHAKVLGNWLDRLPLAAREGVRGYACLRFIIERDGSISEILPVRPSGVPPFNRAAEGALKATDDLPPLPEHFPKQREGVTGCFFYNMHPAEAR